MTRPLPNILPTIFPGPPSWTTVFGASRPLEVELGFGRPHFLFERAAERPEIDIVGIEWKARFVEMARARIAREQIANVVPLHGNAWLLFGALFAPSSVDGVTLNFPDPWWKAKHEKRRIINDTFAQLLYGRLKPGGFVFVQTDVASLLERMLEALESAAFVNESGALRLVTKKPMRARSHREKKCVEQGIPVFRALLRKPRE
jgi:tRNA (guanine-N7-)-methyltransferase